MPYEGRVVAVPRIKKPEIPVGWDVLTYQLGGQNFYVFHGVSREDIIRERLKAEMLEGLIEGRFE